MPWSVDERETGVVTAAGGRGRGPRWRFARSIRTAVGLAAAFAASGCYSYSPIESPSPGATVRVRVPVRSALADPNAPVETVATEGRVLAAGDTLVLARRNLLALGSFQEVVQVDTVRLGRAHLVGVEQQEFSSRRSIGLGVAVAAGVAWLAYSLLSLDGGSTGGGSPSDPPQPAVVPNAVGSVLAELLSTR